MGDSMKQRLAERRAENQRRGRPPALSLAEQAKVVADYLSEAKPTMEQLGAKYGVSKAVIFRVIRKAGL